MKPELIVMLTWHDVTVQNAQAIFEQAKGAPAKCWGFKNVGLPESKMKELVESMKCAGKRVYLEVIDPDPGQAAKYVKLCTRCGIDTLLGTKYSPEALNAAKDAKIEYFPFVGKMNNGAIDGSIEQLANEAKMLAAAGVDGLNLSVFRFRGDGEALLRRVNDCVDIPVCVPGSISQAEQIRFLCEQNVALFTIGGAFFEKKFGESFTDCIENVSKLI